MIPRIREATRDDIPTLSRLIECSVRELQSDDYTPNQIDHALATVCTASTRTTLIDDGARIWSSKQPTV